VQLFYYSIHPSIPRLFNTRFLEFVQITVRYFHVNSRLTQTDYVLRQSNEAVFLTLFIIGIVIVVALLTLMIVSVVNILMTKKKTSAVLNYVLKALSILIVMFLTVLELPLFQLFVTPILCDSQSPYNATGKCFEGSHSAYFGVAVPVLMVFLLLYVVLVTLYADINPCSPIPFAGPQSRVAMAKSAYKVVIVLFYNLDWKGEFVSYFIGFCALFALLLLAYRYRRIVYYKRGINIFSAICDAALTWAYICVLIHIIFTDGNSRVGLIYMGLLCPFACIAYVFIIDKRSFHVIKANVKGLKKDEDVEIFVNIVLTLIEKNEVDSNKIKLEGMLKNYQKTAAAENNDETILKELAEDGPLMDDNKDKLEAWYKLIKSIVEQSLKKFGKSSRLRLLLAYIQHQKIKNKFKSLFELMQATEMKPNYLEEFSIFRYKLIIEEEMIEIDMRHNNDVNGMDVNQMVLFQNNYVKFIGTIEKAVKLHHEFWKELTEDSPDIKKLESLGSSITRIVEDSKKQFDALNEINPNHQKCLELYGKFLKEVVNDDTSGQRILEKAEKVSRQINQRQAGEDLTKMDENSDTAIITISGNFRQIGVITNSNNQITNLLGYNKSEVIGEKIETIMPKIFADSHDDLLLKYFDNPDQPLNIERTVYAMNKKGYISPFNLLAKILPNLDYGIQIVGFLRLIPGFDANKDKYILFSPESGMIFGVSRACYEHFGIRASLTFGKCYNMSELNFDLLCPDILEESKQGALKGNNGITVLLDTTSIQANHPLENEDDESIREEKVGEKEEEEVKAGEQKLKRYKKYNVNAKIIEDKKWFDGKLRVAILKLREVNKDQESQDIESEEEKKEEGAKEKEKQEEHIVEEPEHVPEVGRG
jgi:PAS domain S-box-containing protein